MNANKLKFVFYIFLGLISCEQKHNEMKWSTKEVEHEGIPLLLRKPVYRNIWIYKDRYSQLICLTQSFDSLTSNGLPTSEYNSSLSDFDGEVVNILKEENEGIVFLVETYGGARHYWFYAKSTNDIVAKFNELKKQHSDKKIEITSRNDNEWGFIHKYPYKLY